MVTNATFTNQPDQVPDFKFNCYEQFLGRRVEFTTTDEQESFEEAYLSVGLPPEMQIPRYIH